MDDLGSDNLGIDDIDAGDSDQSIESIDNDGAYICDSCGEEIVIPLDPVAGRSQSYVEDCPVCCNPSLIHVDWVADEVRVWAEREQDRN